MESKKKQVNVLSFLDGISDDSDDDEANDDEVIMMGGGKDDKDDKQDLEQEEKMLRDEFDKWPEKHPNDPKHQVC